MTETDYLLGVLAEEAAELAVACSKAQRFGLHNWHPVTQKTNLDAINDELAHIKAMTQMLGVEFEYPQEKEQQVIKEKIRRVNQYMVQDPRIQE